MTWAVGQKAVINRREIVTIEKVTYAKRAKVKNRTFDVDGRETKPLDPWRPWRLEALTPEIEAEMALASRARAISKAADKCVRDVRLWLDNRFGYSKAPEPADIEKAEALTAAINAVLGGGGAG